MPRAYSELLIASVLMGIFAPASLAQLGTAILNGTVRDQSGAAVPGAALTLAGIEQQFERVIPKVHPRPIERSTNPGARRRWRVAPRFHGASQRRVPPASQPD